MNKCKLGDVAEIITGPFGTQLHMHNYVKEGIPVIMPLNIKDRDFDTCDIARISPNDFDRLSRYATQRDDIIYARKGDVAKHAFITSEEPFLCGSDCLRIRTTSKTVYPLYLSFYLNRPEIKHWITMHAVGSNMPGLNTDILSDVPIELPDYNVQIKVAGSLQIIDDKIKNNNKINAELESIAKTIYDHWFLQFEFPDEKGKPYKSSGGKMVWNEEFKEEIPEGWKIESIANNTLSTEIKPGVKPFSQKTYLATANIDGKNIFDGNIITYTNRETRANMQPQENSAWFAKMKDSIKHLFLSSTMNPITENTILSTGFCGLKCQEWSFEYICSVIDSPYFEKTKDLYAHGVTQEAVNDKDLDMIPLIVPAKNILIKYHNLTKSIYEYMGELVCENKELTSLRDFLLPLLMNGQVGFKEDSN